MREKNVGREKSERVFFPSTELSYICTYMRLVGLLVTVPTS